MNEQGTRTGSTATVTVTSADGTTIGMHRSGDGPPAVLLHGTSGSATNWIPASGLLKDELTLHVVDRRGRGRSGLGDPYAFEREVEDVAAVVEHIGEPAHLVGHSFGAVLALAAARAGVPTRSLVLYEPAVGVEEHVPVEDVVATCERHLAADDPEGCLAAFYGALDEAHHLEMMRQVPPIFEEFLRNAHTIPRELRCASEIGWHLADGVDVSTLLLVGSETHPMFREGVGELARRLPAATSRVIEGHGHLAHAFAPDVFARLVLDFTQGDMRA